MYVAVASVTIHIPESRSLKSKRRVVRSLVERIRTRFGVSIAEVAGQGAWQSATVGFCCVSGSASHAEEVARKVMAFVDSSSAEYEVVDRGLENLSVL